MTSVYVTHPRYTEHNLPGHPEHAGRIRAIWSQMEASGLGDRMKTLEPQMASEAMILAVHTQEFVDVLRWIDETQQQHIHFDPDTYGGPTVYQIARLAAGGVALAVDEVMSGNAANGLAAVRPPGHHSMPDHAMGFCILGNVPIAVRHAQNTYGIERILIVDYDVHHGNGTEAMFYDDDSVLFISTHQYPFYPGTGALNDTGRGKGTGYTMNIPLSAGYGDQSYTAIYEEIVWPAAERFQPQLIVVSAGFDAHWTDPIAGMRLSLTGYAHLNRELIRMADQFCGGKIVFALEGGYNLDALGHGFANTAYALLDDATISDPLGAPKDGRPEPDVRSLLDHVKRIHGL